MKHLIEVKTRAEAERAAPWASIIIKVEGGYMAFEYMSDYETWRQQT